MTRGRTLSLLGTVDVSLDSDVINVSVEHLGLRNTGTIRPSQLGARVVFANTCTCRMPGCAHLAAGALAALDRFRRCAAPCRRISSAH